jgi:tRNA(adenine34) deaminase
MKLAIEFAQQVQEVPVGALIVYKQQVLSVNHNLVKTNNCAIAHAELLVLQHAMQVLQTPYLQECDLYVTLEPCAMCAGAIALSRLKRLFFGAYDEKFGAVEHGAQVFRYSLHKPEIYGGVLENKCKDLIQSFFKNKRNHINFKNN